MKLTGKAKQDFEKWFDTYSQHHHCEEWLENDLYLDEVYLPDTLLNALIVEWFDSVGYHIEVGVYPSEEVVLGISYSYAIFGNVHIDGSMYLTRKEATEQAISIVHEIYSK